MVANPVTATDVVPTTTKPAATKPAVTKPPTAAATKPPTTVTAKPATTTAKPATTVAAVPGTATATDAAALAAAKPATAAAKGYRVQLGAMKSIDLAKSEWARLQQQFPDALGGLKLTVQRADLGAKGIYYRVQAGPLVDAPTAKKVCSDLKLQKQQCLLVRL